MPKACTAAAKHQLNYNILHQCTSTSRCHSNQTSLVDGISTLWRADVYQLSVTLGWHLSQILLQGTCRTWQLAARAARYIHWYYQCRLVAYHVRHIQQHPPHFTPWPLPVQPGCQLPSPLPPSSAAGAATSCCCAGSRCHGDTAPAQPTTTQWASVVGCDTGVS